MNARKLGAAAGGIALIVGLFTGCGSTNSASNATSDGDSNSGTTATYSVDGAKDSIRIASGSENKEVSGAIEQAAKQSKVSVTVDYMGSLDVMDALRNKGHHAGRDYDAVWPASSMWITMGDIKHVVKDQVSTSTTPVVFGVKQSKAEELGWANTDGTTKPVSTKDIMDAVKAKKLSFAMTSATQSNSGASAYMAFLTALNGGKSALVQKIYAPKFNKPEGGKIPVRPDYPPIASGGRNLSLTSLAGAMHNTGYNPAQIYAELKFVNMTQCKPPLDDRELQTITESVTRYRR